MWIDQDSALSEVETRFTDPALRQNAVDMITRGYTVLRNLPTSGLCDEAVSDYYEFCRLKNATERGPKARIVNFHTYSTAASMLLLDPVLMRFLDGLFGREAVLYTSLTFEYGTEQELHRDSPYFETRPFGFYFGVWTALEDVRPGAGALEVLAGGHRIAGLDHKALARAQAGGRAEKQDYDALLARLFEEMRQDCARAGCERKTVPVKKGEKILWHSWMPHGGSAISDPGLTRRSIAAHYIPRGVPVYNVDVFFGIADPDPSKAYSYGQVGSRGFVHQPEPFFQQTYL
jgi:hypothetical protein